MNQYRMDQKQNYAWLLNGKVWSINTFMVQTPLIMTNEIFFGQTMTSSNFQIRIDSCDVKWNTVVSLGVLMHSNRRRIDTSASSGARNKGMVCRKPR